MDEIAFKMLVQRSQNHNDNKQQQNNEVERFKRLVRASRRGQLQLIIETLSEFETQRDAEKIFQKRDPEGKLLINNALLNGHADIVEYILEHWLDAHANIRLSLEGNTSLIHQALSQSMFCAPSKEGATDF